MIDRQTDRHTYLPHTIDNYVQVYTRDVVLSTQYSVLVLTKRYSLVAYISTTNFGFGDFWLYDE